MVVSVYVGGGGGGGGEGVVGGRGETLGVGVEDSVKRTLFSENHTILVET